MPDPWVWDLAECAEYPQALRRRPPRIVHGTLILLVALLATALAWAATTEANLVVRGVGRIRPVTTPVKVFNAARGEILGGGVGARVVQVNARQGDRVRRGDVLVRLETGRLDNEVAKQQRAIRAAEEELVELERLGTLRGLQAQATRAKAQA
ncbi:MAG TPA: biotin/lipoyl-binding protein, partial [Isosphaeraceae bacterium]